MPSASVTGWEGVTQLEGQDTDSEGGLKDELDPKAGANESDRRTEYLSRHHGNDEKGEMGRTWNSRIRALYLVNSREPPREWLACFKQARRKVCFRKKYLVAQHTSFGEGGIREMK